MCEDVSVDGRKSKGGGKMGKRKDLGDVMGGMCTVERYGVCGGVEGKGVEGKGVEGKGVEGVAEGCYGGSLSRSRPSKREPAEIPAPFFLFLIYLSVCLINTSM